MKRCENCAHWSPPDVGGRPDFGTCAKIDDSNLILPAKMDTTRIYTWDYEGYSSGAYVGKDYCCHTFERNPK